MIANYKEISRKIISSYAYVVTPDNPNYGPRDAEQEKVGQTII
jgi:hypothetical protein